MHQNEFYSSCTKIKKIIKNKPKSMFFFERKPNQTKIEQNSFSDSQERTQLTVYCYHGSLTKVLRLK